MSTPLLECRDVIKYFDTPRGRLHAVDGISFTLNKGETLGVVGESGCGKSTLGRTLLGLVPITSGEVLFEGKEVSHLSTKEWRPVRREMQMIFQDPYDSLNPRTSVYEAIADPMKIHKLYKNDAEYTENVKRVMDMVGLDHRYINTFPHELDGGRRQRIGIAKAMALNPKFVVCDEPVSALDVSVQAQVLNLMMDLKDDMGLTYMFISHDLSVIRHISDRIMVLYLGKPVEIATSAELFAHPTHPYTKALLSAIPVPDLSARDKPLEVMQGEVTSPINPPDCCRFASRCPHANTHCRSVAPALQEISPDHFVACHLFTTP